MIVLDTNVVSELMRAAPAPAVVRWVQAQPRGSVVTTAITVAEIQYGIARLPDGGRKRELRQAAEEVFAGFADQVLAFDAAAALAYGDLTADRERAGVPISGFDAQIAAVCRATPAPLATRNRQDFQGTGVALIDPWQAAVR